MFIAIKLSKVVEQRMVEVKGDKTMSERMLI
jgi:hypothetical protein